jgi:hypothetical protein
MSGLSEQTAATARRYLARLAELGPGARAELGERIAAAVRAQVSPPPPPGTHAPAYLAAILAERARRERDRLGVGRQAPENAPSPATQQAQPGPAPAGPPPEDLPARQTGGFVPPA